MVDSFHSLRRLGIAFAAVMLSLAIFQFHPGNCETFERSERIRRKYAFLREKLTAKKAPEPSRGKPSESSSPSKAAEVTRPVESDGGGPKSAKASPTHLENAAPVNPAALREKPESHPDATGLRNDFGKLLFVLDVDRKEVTDLRERVSSLEKTIVNLRNKPMDDDAGLDGEPVAGRKGRGAGESACRDTRTPIALVAGWEQFSLAQDGGLEFENSQDRGLVGLSKNMGRMDVSAFLTGWDSRRFTAHDPSLRSVAEIFKANGVGDGTYSLTEASLNLKEFVVSASYAFGEPFGTRVRPRAGASVKRNTLRLELTPLNSSDSPVFTAITRRGFFSGEFFAGVTADINSTLSLSADGVYNFGGTTVRPSHTEIFEKYGDGTPALAPDAARTAADRLSDKGLEFSTQGWSLRAATSLRFR